jgi:hypothetical protein
MFKIPKIVVVVTVIVAGLIQRLEGCIYFSPMSDYKKLGLLGDKFVYNQRWQLPNVSPEGTEEEAVMLIGGKV